MKVLVTGANGMLGQDLCSTLKNENIEVIPTDVDTLDITDNNAVEAFFSDKIADYIIHCAAYTNVDGAESNPELAEKINVLGTRNLALMAKKYDIPIIAISTDYVFDGSATVPYTPECKTCPISVYGKTKLGGEIAIRENCTKYYILRTSWLYGLHGKNFVETMIKLSQTNDKLKVVDDQVGCPTWTMELVNVIVRIIKEKFKYGIYHTCGGGSTSWYGFTKEIFRLANIATPVSPCTTEEFPRPAKRPKYSIMDNKGLCRDWKEALRDYMKIRSEKV